MDIFPYIDAVFALTTSLYRKGREKMCLGRQNLAVSVPEDVKCHLAIKIPYDRPPEKSVFPFTPFLPQIIKYLKVDVNFSNCLRPWDVTLRIHSENNSQELEITDKNE